MFFKKKSNKLQPQLEEALRLVKQTTFLAAPYLYEKEYHPTEAEITLLKKLHDACLGAERYIGHVCQDVQKRVETS